MACILSVSYDESLLKTRHMMLEQCGYRVVSALGFTDAMKQCSEGGPFDLFVLGHSIPVHDKQALVKAFRSAYGSVVVALKRSGEDLASTGADFQADPGDPAGLLRLIAKIIQARDSAVA